MFLDDRAVRIVDDDAALVAMAQAVDVGEPPLVSPSLIGEVEFVARDLTVENRRGFEAALGRRPATLEADEADLDQSRLTAFKASAVLTSEANDGVEVCSTARS